MGVREDHPTILHGRLNRSSPNAISTANDRDIENPGCMRQFFYEYVEGRRQPPTKAQGDGIRYHAEIDSTLTTGINSLGRIAHAGRRFIPEPGPDLEVEYEIQMGELMLGGIPVIGRVDLAHRRGHHVSPTGLTLPEGRPTVEIKDWKFVKSFDYVQRPETVAMFAYGEHQRLRTGGAEDIRLSLVYFRKVKPEAVKTTALFRPDQVAERWQNYLPVIKDMEQAVLAPRAEDVRPNKNACRNYGGCPHARYCAVGREKTIEEFLGTGAAMSLTPKPEVALQVATLRNEEATAMAQDQATANIVKEIDEIASAGQGMPALGGVAAAAYAGAKGIPLSGSGLVGRGELGPYSLFDAVQVTAMRNHLSTQGLIPTMPVQTAVAPMQGIPLAPPVLTPPVATPPAIAAPVLPPDLPVSNPSAVLGATTPAVTAPVAPPATMAPEETDMVSEALAILRGSKCSKAQRTAAAGALEEALVSRPTVVNAGAAPQVGNPNGFSVFVNCIITNSETDAQPLAPYIDEMVAELTATYTPNGDIRCAPQDGPLGYGRWKGAIAALARSRPPAAGVWFIDARGNEIAETICDALRSHENCTSYVKGF